MYNNKTNDDQQHSWEELRNSSYDMTLYEVYFSIKMREVETVASYVSLRSEISPPDRLIENAYSAVVLEHEYYEQAVKSEESKQWKHAMDEEYNSCSKIIDNRNR